MREVLFVLNCSVALLIHGCSGSGQSTPRQQPANKSNLASNNTPPPAPKITSEKATDVAKRDFVRTLGPLDNYNIVISEEAGAWRIEFRLKRTPSDGGRAGRLLNGGDVIYQISKETGIILDKMIDQ